ncbi:hypothetical protein V5F77_21515 [Xanthobacter sp. DSM 24535]|uniref:hypothetical protein n=1 Tax=Roseixanthobacter psychrophilus TaxID=3119917 RepID=UPI0037281371
MFSAFPRVDPANTEFDELRRNSTPFPRSAAPHYQHTDYQEPRSHTAPHRRHFISVLTDCSGVNANF